MIYDQTIDRTISKKLISEYLDREKIHTPSGKLSASGLGKPLQWQVLKTIGVKGKEFDQYTLRKFQRGNHVEDWLVSQTAGVIDKQVKIEYRGVVGLIDALIDTSEYEFKSGEMCMEIKSITNMAFKWLEKERQIKPGHALQACLYALAKGHKYFAVTYVASDDYRILSMIEETSKYKSQVDQIIDEYNQAIKNKVVPVFVPREDWQVRPEYNDYPEFMSLTQEEINTKISELNVKWPEGGEN